MGFFDDIGKKISETSQGAVQKAKEIADVTKLNSQVSDEQNAIRNAYSQIGEKYYATYAESPLPEFVQLCEGIAASVEKINELNKEIARVKNIKTCKKCGAECAANVQFCPSCGASVSVKEEEIVIDAIVNPTKTCTGCGESLTEDAKFCVKCGTKVEEITE